MADFLLLSRRTMKTIRPPRTASTHPAAGVMTFSVVTNSLRLNSARL